MRLRKTRADLLLAMIEEMSGKSTHTAREAFREMVLPKLLPGGEGDETITDAEFTEGLWSAREEAPSFALWIATKISETPPPYSWAPPNN